MMLRLITILVLLHLLAGTACADKFRLLLPPFSGDPVGKNVSAFLNIEILKSFRINSLERGKPIRRATINHKDIVLSDHSSAERFGSEINADMVYWGKAFKYGDGVIVESSLTIPEIKLQKNTFWKIENSKAAAQIAVDLPNRYYEFKPFLLNKMIYKQFADISDAKVYSDRTFKVVSGKVGPVFRVVQNEYESIKVEYQGKVGYIKFPIISDKPEGTINFINGVIRLLRGDRIRAKESLLKVVSAEDVSREEQVDSRLFLGYIATHLRDYENGRKFFRDAYTANPYSVIVVKYYIMGLIAGAIKPDGSLDKLTADQIADLLKENEKLFEPNDLWLLGCKKIVLTAP